MGLIQKAFGDIITFSRSSNATRVGPDGLIQYAPHNLLVYSEMFADASWVKTSATVTANILAAPNGTVTGDLIESTGAGGRAVQTVSAPSTSVYTYSVYLKKKDTTTVELLCRNNTASVNYAARFDLDTLATSNVSAGATASVVDVGNGWRRCTIITASITSGNSILCYVYGGIGTSGENVYAWGAQLSVGSVPGDYTPTTTAAVYGPRFDFDPVTLAARGLLIEEQRTNLLLYSEQFDNAAWVKTNTTISANVIVAPDGTVTADKLVENTSTLVHDCRQTVIKATSQINYAATFYAKAAERTFVRMFLYNEPSSNRIDATVNLSNGTVSYVTSNGTWTEGGCSVLAIGNGWYRITVTGLSNTGTSVRLLIATSNGPTSGDSVYTGDGTSGIYIWGAQLEAASFATSYIPTVASAVTRSADVATINTLSPFFNATEGTMFAQFDSAASGTNTIAAFDDNTANENYRLRNVGTDPKFTVTDGGVDQCDINGGTIAANTVYNFAAAYKANDFAVCIAGGTVQTDTSGTLPTVDRLRIGTSQAGDYLNGHVRRFAYYPRLLANAELQALTA